ncbi:MAG: hypothetical protein V1861_06765 [Candidatus Micrarchaeota archaeon]
MTSGSSARFKKIKAAIAIAGVICAGAGLFRTCAGPMSEPMQGTVPHAADAPQPESRNREINPEERRRHSPDLSEILRRWMNGIGRTRMPQYVPAFDFGDSDANPDVACREYPAIERYSGQSKVDPLLVRAVMSVESGFDNCHATKVCQSGFRSDDCDNIGYDPRYDIGIDEVDDSGLGCYLPPAPEINGEPAWRWFGFGLGNTIGAPQEIRPEGSIENGCSDSFDPFNPDDASCAVSTAMERALSSARVWIDAHKDILGWCKDERQMEDLTSYIAASMYSGAWHARIGVNHPGCSSAIGFGECLIRGFDESNRIDEAFCGTPDGREDERCAGGIPLNEPPFSCYGRQDIVGYIRDCGLPFLPEGSRTDMGAEVMAAYYRLKNECPGRR